MKQKSKFREVFFMSFLESVGLDKKNAIKWLITIIATAIIALIPAGGLYTEGMKLFMIITGFSLFVIAFEFLPSAVMVIFMPVLYVVTGCAPASAVMAPWLGDIMLMLLGAFAFAAILTDSGLLDRISYALMAKMNGSYTKLMFGMYFVGIVLTFATFGTGYMVLAPLAAGLCISLGEMKTKFGAGIAMSVMLGTCAAKSFTYPITTYGIIAGAAGGLADATFQNMTFVGVLAHNFPMAIVTTLSLFIYIKWYKPDHEIEGGDYFNAKLAELGKTTQKEKNAAVALIIILVYMLSCAVTGMNMNWGFMIVPWLCFMPIPFLYCANQSTFKYMNWDMVFFVAGCMAIGTVASTLGFAQILASLMSAIFSSGGVFTTFGAVFAIIFVMNFLMTPMAIWALLTAPLMQVAIDLGMNQLPFLYCLIGCAEAIVLPYEYVPYLTVYAFGMITMGDFVKMSIVRCLIYILSFLFVLIPFWMLIGLI